MPGGLANLPGLPIELFDGISEGDLDALPPIPSGLGEIFGGLIGDGMGGGIGEGIGGIIGEIPEETAEQIETAITFILTALRPLFGPNEVAPGFSLFPPPIMDVNETTPETEPGGAYDFDLFA